MGANNLRWLIAAAVALLLVAAPLMVAGAQEPEGSTEEEELTATRSWQGSVRVRTLNVRGGPGEGHDIVAKLERGDKVTAVEQTGRWVRIVGLKEEGAGPGSPDIDAWVHRSFVNLPQDFLAPMFGDAENDFVDWAAERGDLAELSIESDERLSVILADATDKSRAELIAFEIGCAYREQLDITESVTVTVWTDAGVSAGWLAQVSCP